ncbi:MAG: homoserine kinase [Chloroflexi bacterium]|nr:homoserine kinase [Chloroflexota bacterium]
MEEARKATVRVPATTANLGPGFDCLGMALDIWSELTVERAPFSITVEGEGSDAPSMPLDERNLVVIGVNAAFEAAGKPTPELSYVCRNEIPYSRGFGSSSAAIVAGLLAGSAICGYHLDLEDLIKIAADIDGHPDNVAPALMGGLCIGIHTDSKWITDQVALPDDLKAVLFVPDVEGPTREARALLADEISRADAIFNIGRAAMLVNAFSTGRLELLRHATEDMLHQPARSAIYPAMKRLIESALIGGAHGAFLSGAGPSVVAFTTGREMTVIYEMAEAARLHNLPGKTMVVNPAATGAYLTESE